MKLECSAKPRTFPTKEEGFMIYKIVKSNLK